VLFSWWLAISAVCVLMFNRLVAKTKLVVYLMFSLLLFRCVGECSFALLKRSKREEGRRKTFLPFRFPFSSSFVYLIITSTFYICLCYNSINQYPRKKEPRRIFSKFAQWPGAEVQEDPEPFSISFLKYENAKLTERLNTTIRFQVSQFT
jgi:hypothetical protein